MKHSSYLSIGEFSRLTGIRTDNLRFYHRIGLLVPEARGENGYRCYTRHQLDSAFLISDLRSLGVGLEEIRRYAEERSPQRMLELFRQQHSHIETEIQRLRAIQELMQLRSDMVTTAMQYKKNTCWLEERKREPLFLMPLLDPSITNDEGIIQAYDYAAQHGINTSFPFGAILNFQTLETQAEPLISRYYFRVRRKHNAWKPAGTYGMFYCSYDDTNPGTLNALYQQTLRFVETSGLRIAGDAYAEYLLDELSTKSGECYSIQIEIPVLPAQTL